MTKRVLITGCSSGIGRLTAEMMASRGWQVAATSRDPDLLRSWADAHEINVFPLDLTEETSIEAVVAAAVARMGGIDVLVNNAGYGLFGPLEGATPEDIDLQFRTNVLGPIALIRHVMPVMRDHRGGTIINISSIGGRTASPLASVYHATKFALEGFSESFRFEAAMHNIRVKLIEPGHFRTGFISRGLQIVVHERYDTALKNYIRWVLAEDRRAPQPEPVAEAILRAAEDRSAKLRFPVHGFVPLLLSRIVPDALWRAALGGGMTRSPKEWGDSPGNDVR
jgi:NAD(P)-dependent dehydrogenase (short-subunit alcohol dehydrogenase family)